MRLRTKLLFAFLVSPAFLFWQSVRASRELRAIGADVDSLDRYTQTEDLRGQVIPSGLGLTLLLTLVTAAVLAGVTAQPIVRLVSAARAVARGDLDAQVPVKSQDELGELSEAFNAMTRRLRSVYEGLEATVQERTEALRRREADLARERKLAAVGRLAAGVAHEVSNPLAVIAASAEGLRDRAREDQALSALPGFQDFPSYLERIENEAYRLKKLVRRLLDFSRGGGVEGPVRREPIELGAV